MKISRSHAVVLKSALQSWVASGQLDSQKAADLNADIEVISFDWKRLAKYSFWVALICIVTSAAAILADDALRALLQSIFNAPAIVRCLMLSILSAFLYWVGMRRRLAHPFRVFSNEAIFFIAVLVTAGAVYELGLALDNGSGHFSILLLLSFFIYGVIGYRLRSNLIWLFALISLGSWMGTETGYASGWGAYYLGMNYPLRFVLFGGVLTATALLLEKNLRFEHFFRSTLAMGLLYFFVALWIMSIFVNYGDMSSWESTKQIELFHWSLIFAIAAGGAIYHGLRFDNGMTKGFGITFLFINLYTRFFEYFWNATHKAVFFGLLGISFWYLGSHAEKIWHMGETKKKA